MVGGELDLAGFHRAAVFVAVLLALGGVASWVGVRNPAAPVMASQVSPRE